YRSGVQGQCTVSETAIKRAVATAGRRQEATVLDASLGKRTPAYLIRADHYFDREFLYGPPAGDYPDNAERFSFVCHAALELLRQWPVEIVHCHDWQAALAI